MTSTPQYTCLIRLPFKRGDFVDPPPVKWDANKDKALWKIISEAANSKDIDWQALSDQYGVSLSFLLQQAAWLYERHFAQMRAQMKKLGASSNAPSPVPPPESASQQHLGVRTSRAPSALSTHSRDNFVSSSGIVPATRAAAATPMSRTPSTRTGTQPRTNVFHSPREPTHPARSFRSSFRRPTLESSTTTGPLSPQPASDSSRSSSEDDRPAHPSVAKSQLFRRAPDLRTINSDDAEDDDDDDDPDRDSSSSGSFLPFVPPQQQQGASAATVKSPPAGSARWHAERARAAAGERAKGGAAPPGALSPRHRADIERVSDGPPSMGSSFSDLDDASVTQSALEDALLSNMQHGNIASRMSTFSQALKSRYLPQ